MIKRKPKLLKLELDITEEIYEAISEKASVFDYSIEDYIKYLFIKDNSEELVSNGRIISFEEELEFQEELMRQLKQESHPL